jgi:hypothetical protein
MLLLGYVRFNLQKIIVFPRPNSPTTTTKTEERFLQNFPRQLPHNIAIIHSRQQQSAILR